jgi:hypothetical protein
MRWYNAAMSPDAKRRKSQAMLLFLLMPIGVLGFVSQFTDRPLYPGAAIVFAALTLGALGLGVWLWRKKDDEPPSLSDDELPNDKLPDIFDALD